MRFRALIAVAILVAACGAAATDPAEGVASLDDGSESTVATVAEMDAEEAAIAFTECMRTNGIEMEDPTVDSEGNVIPGRPTDLGAPEERSAATDGPPQVDDEMGAAIDECRDLLQGADFGFSPEDQTELEDQMLALAECLRDEGLDVADPDFSGEPEVQSGGGGGGVRATGPLGLDFQDPEVEAAMEECEEFAPNFGGGPNGGGFVVERGESNAGDDE